MTLAPKSDLSSRLSDFFPGSGKTYGMLLRKGEYGWYLSTYHHMEDYVRVPYLEAHQSNR